METAPFFDYSRRSGIPKAPAPATGVFLPQFLIEHVEESHESYPYNRNMAQALYRSTFLESWGSGIHRIIEGCREQCVEDPTWRWDGGFVYVTFKRPVKYGTE